MSDTKPKKETGNKRSSKAATKATEPKKVDSKTKGKAYSNFNFLSLLLYIQLYFAWPNLL